MGFPILVRCHFYIETGPRSQGVTGPQCLLSRCVLHYVMIMWKGSGCHLRLGRWPLGWDKEDFFKDFFFNITVMSHEYGISNCCQLDCLFKSFFRITAKHQSSLSLALCEGNRQMIGGFPSQRDSNAESFSMSWHHDGTDHGWPWILRFVLCQCQQFLFNNSKIIIWQILIK